MIDCRKLSQNFFERNVRTTKAINTIICTTVDLPLSLDEQNYERKQSRRMICWRNRLQAARNATAVRFANSRFCVSEPTLWGLGLLPSKFYLLLVYLNSKIKIQARRRRNCISLNLHKVNFRRLVEGTCFNVSFRVHLSFYKLA